ncbi:MAG: SDR family oxidoreductase [Candidatus Buchananbacteria bacterium]|nr:SDR family oxidoreductase [Candidatus Buchananbacteria bacterium]
MKLKTIKEMFDFKGQTVVVTGGAKGIGYGIVERFVEAGANVVISDIDDQTGETKAKSLGKKVAYIHTDVSQESDVQNLIKTTVERFGSLDVFVNNAGIFPTMPALDMDVELWEKIQAVNLRGVFLCSKEAAKIMVAKSGGVIVNIASIDALHPSQPGLSAYDASKHGVWGFTKNFALEVAPKNIRVNAIAPGGIVTEGVEAMTQGAIKVSDAQSDTIKQFAARIPMGRMGIPDDIASVTLFLASDAARYMTGSIVVVDGGYLLT